MSHSQLTEHFRHIKTGASMAIITEKAVKIASEMNLDFKPGRIIFICLDQQCRYEREAQRKFTLKIVLQLLHAVIWMVGYSLHYNVIFHNFFVFYREFESAIICYWDCQGAAMLPHLRMAFWNPLLCQRMFYVVLYCLP